MIKHFGYENIHKFKAQSLLKEGTQVFIELIPYLQQHYAKDNKLHLLDNKKSFDENIKHLVENYEYRTYKYDGDDCKIIPSSPYKLVAFYYTNNKSYRQFYKEQHELLQKKKESQQGVLQL